MRGKWEIAEVWVELRWSHPCCSFCPHQGSTVKNLQLSSYLPSPSLISTWVFGFTVNGVCLLSLTEGETRLFGSQQIWVVSNETPQRATPPFEAPNKVRSWRLQHAAICCLRKLCVKVLCIYYDGSSSIKTKKHEKLATKLSMIAVESSLNVFWCHRIWFG